MGLRIRTNVESLSAQRSLTNNQNALNQSMERLSSGARINKAADDAAGLAISENLNARVRSLSQAKRNANDGISMVQVTEASLSEMTNIMVRLRELTIQGASDTLGDTERGYLQKEYTQLVDEIDRISKGTEFNGTKLLSGETAQGITIQVGPNGTPDDVLTLQMLDGADGINVETLGLSDLSLEGDRETIAGNLSLLDDALTTVASSRATLGALQSRVTSTIKNIDITSENLSSANSRIRDTDFAAETASLTQARILSSAGISILTQANAKPEMALALLR